MAVAGLERAGVTLFITKVWGFGEPAGPLQFPTEGWRRNALEKLREGDLVVLVGTQGGETAAEERGRLLGIMEPTRTRVASLDFELRQAPADFDAAGRYKWPFGLHNRRAWMLVDRPRLSDVSSRAFSMDAAQGIVALTDEEEARVEGLRRREVALLTPRLHASERRDRGAVAARRGPPPSTTIRRGVMHMRRAPASTYAMELVGTRTPAFKVGWAFDPTRRRDQFNQAAAPSLGGLRYQLAWTQRWDSARLAYAFEQRLIGHFAATLLPANREIVAGVRPGDFAAAWARLAEEMLRGR